ncbi:DUF4129 domain-containing protein [Rhodopirellula sp. MGV]|uniref:DUF4129 domain-containing protein n=1 Tax=Rhodopirellula sp. MGV TaxID=2023130 RepID=UPI000B972E49|nr:DUF4129 domain-containing protein [Rhodopirellula sp. MGV]OYP31721.1 hypothetical protein CGZ80_20730 [Rhodopirellula sp. MGV]PNY34021.1 DUF4129 domain-containing protein [Rhodopirellula baltica]
MFEFSRLRCLLGLWIALAPAAASAQDASGNPSLNLSPAARSPVGESLSATPWYDADQNQLIPITVVPRRDDSVNRESRWLPKAPAIQAKSKANANPTTGNASTLFGSGFTLSNLFGWLFLVSMVIVIVGLIVYAIGRAEVKLASAESESGGAAHGKLPDQQTLERMKHLPPELRRTDVNLRSECERLMQAEEYDKAIILLLGHQLLLLDKYGLLRLARGKTNGKYVRETHSHDASCAAWLRQTADAFEHSYFGRHEIGNDVFARLWEQNREMEHLALTHGAPH